MSDTSPDADDFEPDRLFEMMPRNTYPRQRLVLVAALRNPFAYYSDLREIVTYGDCDIRTNTVESTLLSFEQGTFGQRNQNTDHEALSRRGGSGQFAETYDELTEKQKAIVDFLAKWPVAYDELNRTTLAEAVTAIEGTPVSPTYPKVFLDNYGEDFICEYRETLDDDEIPDEKLPPLDFDSLGKDKTVEQRLRDGGVNTLPDHNLDIDSPEDIEPPQWVIDYIDACETFGYDTVDIDERKAAAQEALTKPADDDGDDSQDAHVQAPTGSVDLESHTAEAKVDPADGIGRMDVVMNDGEIVERVSHNVRQPIAEPFGATPNWDDPADVTAEEIHEHGADVALTHPDEETDIEADRTFVFDQTLEHMRELRDMARREYQRTNSDEAAIRLTTLEHLLDYADSRIERGSDD